VNSAEGSPKVREQLVIFCRAHCSSSGDAQVLFGMKALFSLSLLVTAVFAQNDLDGKTNMGIDGDPLTQAALTKRTPVGSTVTQRDDWIDSLCNNAADGPSCQYDVSLGSNPPAGVFLDITD
jgi:hypothetical protein